MGGGNGVGGIAEDYGYGSAYSPMNPSVSGGGRKRGSNNDSRSDSSPKHSSESEVSMNEKYPFFKSKINRIEKILTPNC